MVGGLPGGPPYEPTGAGDGGQVSAAGGGGGARAPSAGSSRVGACWGPRTTPAVLMLGPPNRGGLGPAERMRRRWPRWRNSRRPLERRRWLGYWQDSWRPERRRVHVAGVQCGSAGR